MFTILGLGNPGTKYHYTRHNVGALFVEYLGGEAPQTSKSLYNLTKQTKYNLLTLNTYMNNSGKGVLSLLSKSNIKKEDLIVVYDDLDLDFGKIKIKQQGSDGGHNGIKDIANSIGKDFFRIRIGIGRPEIGSVTNFVLQKFKEENYKQLLNDIFPRLKEYIELISEKGIDSALGMAGVLKK